jgi:hypothetical protein
MCHDGDREKYGGNWLLQKEGKSLLHYTTSYNKRQYSFNEVRYPGNALNNKEI